MVATATDGRIQDSHMLLVSVASVPGVATFIVGVILLVMGLKRSVGRGEMKGNE